MTYVVEFYFSNYPSQWKEILNEIIFILICVLYEIYFTFWERCIFSITPWQQFTAIYPKLRCKATCTVLLVSCYYIISFNEIDWTVTDKV